MPNNFGGYFPQDERLRQQITDFQAQWDLLTQKLARLRKDLILETRTEEKFRLEHLITELEAEREHLEPHLRDLETQAAKGFDSEPLLKAAQTKSPQEQEMPVSIKEINTMELTVTLRRQIIDFFMSLPNIQDPNTPRALIQAANLDSQLLNQISFTGAPGQFFQLLLPILLQYGRLKDGRPALQSVLEAAKDLLGEDGRTACDNLIRTLGWTPSEYLTLRRLPESGFDSGSLVPVGEAGDIIVVARHPSPNKIPGVQENSGNLRNMSEYKANEQADRAPEHAALKKEAARLETLRANHETMLKRLQLMESKYVEPPLELLNKQMAKEEEIAQITAQLEELKRKLAL